MTKPIRLHPHLFTLRPNARLKAACQRRRWSQQELADQLHITANSVSRWERGISSPGPYFRRQLCDLFGLSAQELGLLPGKQEETEEPMDQVVPPTRTCWPTLCTLPFQRNPFFTGREEVLAQLHHEIPRFPFSSSNHQPEISCISCMAQRQRQHSHLAPTPLYFIPYLSVPQFLLPRAISHSFLSFPW